MQILHLDLKIWLVKQGFYLIEVTLKTGLTVHI